MLQSPQIFQQVILVPFIRIIFIALAFFFFASRFSFFFPLGLQFEWKWKKMADVGKF